MGRFKAVVFDMDGVLIDSEMHWRKTENDFFASLGITLTDEMITKMTGASLQNTVQMMKDEFGLSQSVSELYDEKMSRSEEIYTKLCVPMPGVDETLKRLRDDGYKMAVASGSFLYRIEMIVKRFGWAGYFDQLISTDHVGLKGKPDPAIYLYSAEVLKLSPAECVAVEDSENGVKSAQAAGMKCIAVPDPRWSFGDTSMANITVGSLHDEKLFSYLNQS